MTPWRTPTWQSSLSPKVAIDSNTGRLVDANSAAAVFFGYSVGELLGKTYSDILDACSIFLFEAVLRNRTSEPLTLSSIFLLTRLGERRFVDGQIWSAPGETASSIRLFRFEELPPSSPDVELHRLNWALGAFARSSSALLHSKTLEELMKRVCDAIVAHDVYVLACVALALPDPGKPARFVASAGPAMGYVDGLALSWSEDLPQGRGPFGRSIRSGEPLLMRDALSDPIFGPWRDKALSFGLRSSVTAPFKNGDAVLGALIVYASRPDAFGSAEVALFSQLGEEMALAVSMREERARLAAAEQDLRLARAELQQLIHASTIGEMAASIAHEINQPIGAIIINSEASMRWLAMEPPNLDKAREALQRTIRDANRTNDVINRIRSLVRKDRIEQSALLINDLICDALSFTRNEQEQGGVVVETNLAKDLPAVCGDPVQLQQVMINLIGNAIDAMQDVTDRPRQLRMRSECDGAGDLIVTVEDSGVGMDDLSRDQIYKPFFTTKKRGMGMGLTISRSIVEAHGGRMGARPRADGGTIFWFTLPPAREAA